MASGFVFVPDQSVCANPKAIPRRGAREIRPEGLPGLPSKKAAPRKRSTGKSTVLKNPGQAGRFAFFCVPRHSQAVPIRQGGNAVERRWRVDRAPLSGAWMAERVVPAGPGWTALHHPAAVGRRWRVDRAPLSGAWMAERAVSSRFGLDRSAPPYRCSSGPQIPRPAVLASASAWRSRRLTASE